MKSLAFPDMFTNTKTNVVTDKAATLSNMKLILQTNLRTLFGDPGYGNNLQDVIFSVNNILLKDIVKDSIYNCLYRYIPQLVLNRDDISVTQDKTELTIKIKAYNKLTNDIDVYDISLMKDGDDTSQLV